ncbi:MAG: hypothetical protein CL840_18035 [Crocinitomicaceae bacterium]|nr:hypothetical protein [Crocinitomicaceae bacterium]|tara:strand:- start:32277 stop:33773 length:1497 start_codon:yes stop_codon:yes gene_type:complete
MNSFIKVLVIVLVLIPVGALAQDTTATGYLVDSKTNEPLPFANIGVDGRFKGTVTNMEGHYILNLSGIDQESYVSFSYIGYESRKMSVAELLNTSEVRLKQTALKLDAVEVSSRPLKVKEIVELIEENYDKNYPKQTAKRRVFFHKFEKVPFPDKEMISVKKSNFEEINAELMSELMALVPDTLIEYQDVMLDLYSHDGERKIVPISAISIEEGSQKDLEKKFEQNLGKFFGDVGRGGEDEDIYYKWRSGIFSQEIESSSSADSNKSKETTLKPHEKSASNVKSEMLSIMKGYASLHGGNWEFISSPGKYRYKKKGVTVIGEELVYEISFRPKSRGLYEGVMYVSTSSYAIIQLDYAFKKGKDDENIHLLGFGHSMNNKTGRIIFEKGSNGYYAKYINAHKHESASIERNFSIIKKKRRWFIDKTLKEIKFDVNAFFDTYGYWEILVVEKNDIQSSDFEQVVQPKTVQFKKEYAFSSEAWNNSTVIAPSTELKKYKRK